MIHLSAIKNHYSYAQIENFKNLINEHLKEVCQPAPPIDWGMAGKYLDRNYTLLEAIKDVVTTYEVWE